MENKKPIKVIFNITAVSVIEDTADETKGEASTGYEYAMDTSMPELAYSLAGFLKAIDTSDDLKAATSDGSSPGQALLTLVEQFYNMKEE